MSEEPAKDKLCCCTACGVVHVAAMVISGLEIRTFRTVETIKPGEEFGGKMCYACGTNNVFRMLVL